MNSNSTSIPDITQWTSAPLRITTETVLETTPNHVFRAFSDPDQMCRLFPWMHKITVDFEANKNPLKGSSFVQGQSLNGRDTMIRRCYFGNGLVLEEEIVHWQAPHSYVYRGIDETHPFGMTGHAGSVHCQPHENGTWLSWKHYFQHSNPAAMSQQLMVNIDMALSSLIARYGGQQMRQINYAEAQPA